MDDIFCDVAEGVHGFRHVPGAAVVVGELPQEVVQEILPLLHRCRGDVCPQEDADPSGEEQEVVEKVGWEDILQNNGPVVEEEGPKLGGFPVPEVVAEGTGSAGDETRRLGTHQHLVEGVHAGSLAKRFPLMAFPKPQRDQLLGHPETHIMLVVDREHKIDVFEIILGG